MPYETALGALHFPLLVKLSYKDCTFFQSLFYTTYRLLLMQNLIIALQYFDTILSLIYYSKRIYRLTLS